MKRAMKLIALLLTVVTVFTLGAVGCSGGESIDTQITYKPLMGVQSDWINNNPDRGYRTEICINLYDTAQYNPEMKDSYMYLNINDDDKDLEKQIIRICNQYLSETNNKLAIAYINFHDCNDAEAIPDRYLEVLDIFLDYCRAKKVRILWRHAYGDCSDKYISNPEDKAYLDNVCADEEHMIKHIKQLGEYIAKNLDVIHKVSSGVIGNGELVANFQWPPVDFNNVIDAIVRYMCVPNGLQFTVRMPRYKNDLLEAYKKEHGEDYPYANYIGFNNDAVFGETAEKDFHSGCWQYNHDYETCFDQHKCFTTQPNYIDEWQWVTETAAYTSQSGEMYTNRGMYTTNRMPLGIDVIVQMAHHRHTTLSNWHTMGEVGVWNSPENNVMLKWIEYETVTPELLDSKGIIYDPNWFIDENGEALTERNPYEFIRDHLGYKLVADSATFKGTVGKGKKPFC